MAGYHYTYVNLSGLIQEGIDRQTKLFQRNNTWVAKCRASAWETLTGVIDEYAAAGWEFDSIQRVDYMIGSDATSGVRETVQVAIFRSPAEGVELVSDTEPLDEEQVS